MAKKRYRKPGDTRDLQCILWTLIREVEDRVFEPQAEPLMLDDLLRIAHAMAQLSGSYLKVCEVATLEQGMQDMEALVQSLQASRNGNGHITPTA